jgi:predicted RecA/RadA family phage recombinase
MAGKLIRNGETITLTAPTGGYASGDYVNLISMVALVLDTAAAGVAVEALVVGVVSVNKKAETPAWAQGDTIYRTATGAFTNVVTSNIPAGICWEAAATGATTGVIKLAPIGALA